MIFWETEETCHTSLRSEQGTWGEEAAKLKISSLRNTDVDWRNHLKCHQFPDNNFSIVSSRPFKAAFSNPLCSHCSYNMVKKKPSTRQPGFTHLFSPLSKKRDSRHEIRKLWDKLLASQDSPLKNPARKSTRDG